MYVLSCMGSIVYHNVRGSKMLRCAAVLVSVIAFAAILNACRTTEDRSNDAAPAQAAPEKLPDTAAVHNLWRFAPGVYSGSMPHGDAGFDDLRQLGIKTVISVDGARPDLERATARDMRYVHIPIQYSGIDPDEQAALAQAIHDLPRPIYVHCHHGRHRGPAAAAAGLVCTSELTPDAGVTLLKEVGTSSAYPGLYSAVGTASPLSNAQLDALDQPLPAHAEVRGLVATMAAIDRTWDHLRAIRAADWKPPADHPDLVPLNEAGLLADHFRTLMNAPETSGRPADFRRMLEEATATAQALEDSLAAENTPQSTRWFEGLAANCKACHVQYRNE
jgi:hypothetical protein